MPAIAAAVYLISAGVRVLEWPKWAGAGAWLDGRPIMPTADAYAWLAGAEGTGRLADWPMSVLIAGLAGMFQQAPEWVAFWLPVALGPLPGVLIAMLCMRRGYWLAALAAGVFAGTSLGYLGRTRLGYADTDLFALALAVAMAWSWATGARALVVASRENGFGSDHGWRLGAAVTVAWMYMLLYPSGYLLALAILAGGAAYAWLAGRRNGQRLEPGLLLWSLGALVLSLHLGVAGLIAGLALCALLVPGAFPPSRVKGGLILGLALLAAGVADAGALEEHFRRAAAYAGWTWSAPVHDWQLPSVAASIQETGSTGVDAYIERVGTHWVLLLIGLGGYVLVLRRWPQYLTFLPLLVLGLAGYFLGHRFAMYAAPALGLGLGLGVARAVKLLDLSRMTGAGLQALLAVSLIAVIGWRALEPGPDPVLQPGHARALQDLQKVAAHQGRVWDWWSYGYAAQYYAGLPTLADGGNTSRARIFALGQVFGAESPLQAAQTMKLGAMARVAQNSGSTEWRTAAYAAHPLDRFENLPATTAQREFDGLGERRRSWPEPLPDEFLVLRWSTLRQVQWISYFSRWTLTDGPAGYGQIMTLRPPVRLDEEQGLLHTPEGAVELISIDILDDENHYHNRWPRATGAHAVINNANGEGVLMETALYRTMAVQMLLADPGRFDEHFELVSDRFPAARVYRVR